MTGSAWAQAPGDIVIVGSSPEVQAKLEAYWEELLKLNAARKPAQSTEPQPTTETTEAQPVTDSQEAQTDVSDEDFEEDIPEAESEDAGS